MNNLRSEVIELRNEGLEKDKILNSLVNKIKEDEATFKAQAETQKCEIEDLRKQLAEAKLKCAIAEADRPAEAAEFAKNARANGFGVILCAAGMAAHLAGAFAANTTLPYRA